MSITQPAAETIHHISLPLIVPSRWQPREGFDAESLLELAKHIDSHGLMYPVILFRNEDGEFELVAGERRTRAIAALGLVRCSRWIAEHGSGMRVAIQHVAEHGWAGLADDLKADLVDVTVAARIEANDDHRRLHELAVADNLQRRNLSALEEGRALDDLMTEYDLSQRDVARQIGWSQSKVAQRLALLKLVPEARQALSTRVLSPTHARHLAKLPAGIQPAVTAHVKDLIEREGSQAATERQVAVMAGQIRSFLKPVHWLPPSDTIITAEQRNNLRLVHHLVQAVDLEDRAGAILSLRDGIGRYSYDTANLTGIRPENLADRQIAAIADALDGGKQNIAERWRSVALSQHWICDRCRFRDLTAPDPCDFSTPCAHWQEAGADAFTCRAGFTLDGEDLIVPIDYGLRNWAQELGLEHVAEPFPHFAAFDAWRDCVEQATVRRRAQQQEAAMEQSTRHVRELAAYWAELDTGRFAVGEANPGAEHFQAHRCERCVHYREDLLERHLPPCQFVDLPLARAYGTGTRAPEFGVLVRRDALMVPRCEMYRMAIVGIAPTPGFVLPGRDVVLDWLHRILVQANRATHSSTILAPLCWLPYERTRLDEVHHTDKLLRYVKRSWDQLGDERVATLLTVAASEARAMSSYRGALHLLDPTTLQVDEWEDVGWVRFLEGERSHGYPVDWPAPWVTRK